ncbi:hypothetical protein DVH05_026376 [Phytophthora capsici]|nr:hypothetical protein DVH05_026376 [Phytophthora capsici]
MFRRLSTSSDAILALNESFNFADGSTSDIAQQLYIRYQKGDVVDPVNITSVPDTVVWRLSSHKLVFEDLPGIVQRAVLWDTGYGLSDTNDPVQIYTLDGRSMAALAVTRDEVYANGCTAANCTQPNGEIAYSNEYCNGEQMLSTAKCMVTVTEYNDISHTSMWSTGGKESVVPEINLVRHSWVDSSINTSYIVHSVHTAPGGIESPYSECLPGIYGSLVIPCFSKGDLSNDVWPRMSVPVASEWVNIWLSQLAEPESPSGSSTLLWIPICLGSAVVLVAVVWIYRWNHQKQTHEHSVASRLWNDDQIIAVRIPREKVILQNLLSRGGFGEVYAGTFNNQRVAVKVLLNDSRKDIRQVESFLTEAKMMAELDHPNIVRLVGVAWDSLTDLCVVLEFIENGDLRSLLQVFYNNNHAHGFDPDKLQIAQHVAHGLTYLHSLSTPVLHRDLKSRNILLTADLEAKLTGFGISRESSKNTMTAGIGTSLWMAPEVMIGGRYNEKADSTRSVSCSRNSTPTHFLMPLPGTMTRAECYPTLQFYNSWPWESFRWSSHSSVHVKWWIWEWPVLLPTRICDPAPSRLCTSSSRFRRDTDSLSFKNVFDCTSTHE